MAFDLKTFRTRSITAVIFTVIMLLGLMINIWGFMLLMLIIHFGCWLEFISLLKKIYGIKYLNYIVLGIFYITLPIIMISDLRLTYIPGNAPTDNMLKVIPCGIVFSIWINDTMAYLVGSFMGKHPLSKISPKKTWEGTIGGGLLCIVIISCTGYFTNFFTIKTWIVISAIAALFGTLGDLLESKIKRAAQVKDSGTLMPGHGGFLDRFDSFLIAVPFVWLYTELFLKT